MKVPYAGEPGIVIVVTTVGTQEQALDIARHLVERKLAACVNIVPGVRSLFRWKGVVNDETELLLLVKTVRGKYPDVAAAIKALHAYELPEILAYPAAFADEAFATWIVESTGGAGEKGKSRRKSAAGPTQKRPR